MKPLPFTRGFFIRPFNYTFPKEITDNIFVYWVDLDDSVGFLDLNEKAPIAVRGVADIFVRARTDTALPGGGYQLFQIAAESWKINAYSVMYVVLMIVAGLGGIVWTLKALKNTDKSEFAKGDTEAKGWKKSKNTIILIGTVLKDLFHQLTTLMYLSNVKFLYPVFTLGYMMMIVVPYFFILIDAYLQSKHRKPENYSTIVYIPLHFIATLLGLYQKMFGESSDSIVAGIILAAVADGPQAFMKVMNNLLVGSQFTPLQFIAPLLPIFKFTERITKAVVYKVQVREGLKVDERGSEYKARLLETRGSLIFCTCCCYLIVPFAGLFYVTIFQSAFPTPDWAVGYRAVNGTNTDPAKKPF